MTKNSYQIHFLLDFLFNCKSPVTIHSSTNCGGTEQLQIPITALPGKRTEQSQNNSWHRVIASVEKGLHRNILHAARRLPLNAPYFFDCFQTILRTCGNIRTFRSLHRRYIFLIEPYHLNQKFLYHVHSLLYDAFLQDAEKHSRSRESSCPWLRLSLLLQYQGYCQNLFR